MGKYVISEINSRYTILRHLLHQIQEGTSSSDHFLQWRRDLVESLVKNLKDWQTEVQNGRKHIDDAYKIADEIGPAILRHRWKEKNNQLGPVSTVYAYIWRALSTAQIVRDESDIWWKPFISHQVPAQIKASLQSDTKVMRECMTVLNGVRLEISALDFVIEKLLNLLDRAAIRNIEIETQVTIDISLSQVDCSLDKIKKAG